jgi:hypothetical protein
VDSVNQYLWQVRTLCVLRFFLLGKLCSTEDYAKTTKDGKPTLGVSWLMLWRHFVFSSCSARIGEMLTIAFAICPEA